MCMKAWNDLISDKYVTMYTTEKSMYYIDKGVRIERFNESGDIIVQNTMTNSEKFVKVTPQQYEVFENLGWYPGILKVNIDTLCAKIIKAKYLIERAKENNEPTDQLQKNYDKLSLKKDQHLEKFNKFVNL